MKIAVTGAAGFMGSWLADELAKRGHEVIGVDDISGSIWGNKDYSEKGPAMRSWHNDGSPGSLIFYKADCRDLKKMRELTEGCDAVFHLAAYAAEGQSVFSPIAINDINLRGMNTMLVAAVQNGVKKFIFTSSMAVYGDGMPPFFESQLLRPGDPYGAGKAYCEKMLEIFHDLHGLNYVILRPHNVYGPYQNIADPYRNVLGIWMNRILRGKPPIIYGDGEQTRAFSYIEDVTPAIANALDVKIPAIINVGGKKPYTLNEACEIVRNVCSNEKGIMAITYAPARLGDVKHAWCSTDRSKRLLGYEEKVGFEEGVRRMWKWAQDVGPQEPTWTLPLEIEKGAPEVWRKRLM